MSIKERLANLLTVKSIITICLTGAFTFLSITGVVTSTEFLTVFTMIISFYFGTQTKKES